MIIWINGSFGVGKTETANALHEILPKSHIYDPEQVGYFLWDNFPDEMKRKGDFQDIDIWRSINYDVIKHISHNFDGYIIIPMTIVDPRYYRQIIGRLISDDIKVYHFILTAPKDTVTQRLKNRGEQDNSWAEQQIEKCLKAFENDIHGIKIDTDLISIADTAKLIVNNIGMS